MRCCDTGMWSIYHSERDRTVAWGCRLCGKVSAVRGFEKYLDWAVAAWYSLRAYEFKGSSTRAPRKIPYPPAKTIFAADGNVINEAGLNTLADFVAKCDAFEPKARYTPRPYPSEVKDATPAEKNLHGQNTPGFRWCGRCKQERLICEFRVRRRKLKSGNLGSERIMSTCRKCENQKRVQNKIEDRHREMRERDEEWLRSRRDIR